MYYISGRKNIPDSVNKIGTMKDLIKQYLKSLNEVSLHGDAREESFYPQLASLIKNYAELKNIKRVDITILPKKTEAGNPDFRIWDGKNHITGYVEAKEPSITNLDYIEKSPQLERYIKTFPNVILTNFYEFRLYRNGRRLAEVTIGRPFIANKLRIASPIENIKDFEKLFDLFFSFSLPKVQSAKSLAVELAKRTRFLRDEVIKLELEENGSKGHNQIASFYKAFKKYLISTLTETQFADLYSQTITYGLFASRTRAEEEFNRELAFKYIPNTIGILRDIFQFISLGKSPKSLQILVEDISEILRTTDVKKILHEYNTAGKGKDPIIHFYETFLSEYDPAVREKRGVYYTPEPVVKYIVRAVHSILKSNFNLGDGLANSEVKLLDPAAGTLTFPAEAIRTAFEEYSNKYGEGGLRNWIRKHILKNFYAFELLMAPYSIGHLKISFVLEELGYKLGDDERFKLFLTNALEMEEIEKIGLPGLISLSEESHFAGEVKKLQPILVILGNPPYSANSANFNPWTEKLLKEDIVEGVGIPSYYKVEGKPLGEKNPKLLQDDYVKFIRFAQWKIEKVGYGIVGMITNHGYLDNPTFRGMRQSLTKTFDEIYVLDLHGNSLKREKTPDGGKDENVFEIRQGVAISIFVKNKKHKRKAVYHKDIFGLREGKYSWLEKAKFRKNNYIKLKPTSPWYFFIPRDINKISYYLKWKSITEIFKVSNTGVTTSRDKLVIDFDSSSLKNKILMLKNKALEDELLLETFKLRNTKRWNIGEAREKLRAEKENIEEKIRNILYRPFDVRKIYYSDILIERSRKDLMTHMFNDNLSICFMRQFSGTVPYSHFLISSYMVDNRTFFSSKGTIQQAPLYLYSIQKGGKSHHSSSILMLFEPEVPYGRVPNIAFEIFEKLEQTYGKKTSPEEILYYLYGIFYSEIYRNTYLQFLEKDFPRVPFTSDYELFKSLGKLGKKLSDLHLLKSSYLKKPTVKYQGSSENDRIEKIIYKENKQRIYINKEKYFEGVKPEVWNYHVGGYQVLNKYLKDRKNRLMDNTPYYCRIATAINETIKIQKQIDEIYPQVEKKLIKF